MFGLNLVAQEPILIPGKPPYDRKEEILHAGKRYRIYNNYLTIGGSFFNSNLRTDVQKGVGLDYHFHIKRHYFQTGFSISGYEFLENNQTQARFGYGYRKENANVNLAFFGGATLFTGVYGVADTAGTSKPEFYSGVGAYVCAQAVKKLSYDIGIGAEVFAELNYKQAAVGIKILMFFSGAYRGPKKNFNPNVRSENRK